MTVEVDRVEKDIKWRDNATFGDNTLTLQKSGQYIFL